MKSKLKIMSGIAIFAFALVLNLQYALDDYEISTNSLVTEVLAQTGGNGGDGCVWVWDSSSGEYV